MPWVPKRPQFPWRTVLRILVPIVVLFVAIQVIAFILDARSAPNRLRKLSGQAQLHVQLGQLDAAAAALEDALEIVPEDAACTVRLAQVRRAQGRPGDAIELLRVAHDRRPGDPTLSVALGALLLECGRAIQAAEVLEPQLPTIRKITDPLERIRALLVAGRAAAGMGALLRAEALYREATRVGPAPVTTVAKAAGEATLALAELYGRSGRADLAEEALRAAKTFIPWDTRITVIRARLLEQSGQVTEAIAELQPLAADGRNVIAVSALGDVLLRAGRLDEATALADRLPAQGTEVGAHLRGAVALARGDAAAIDSEAGRVSKVLPASPLAFALRGHAAASRRDLALARREFEAALRVAPLVDAELALLDIEERLGDLPALAGRAERLLSRTETRPWALRALVSSWSSEPVELGPALFRLQAALDLDPSDVRLQTYMGVLRLAAGDPARGALDLARLLVAPDLATAVSVLADTPEGASEAIAAIEIVGVQALERAHLTRSRLCLAQLLAQLHRPDLARVLAAAAVMNEADARVARLLLAQLAVGADDVAGALGHLAVVRAETPDDVGLLIVCAELELRRSNASTATTLLQRAAAQSPDSPLIQARLGRALALAGRTDEAGPAFALARQLEPRLPSGHEDAVLELLAGRPAAAARRFRAAVAATGDPRFAAALAATLACEGQLVEASSVAERWRAVAPQAAEGAALVGALTALAGDGARARGALRNVGLSPVIVDAILRLPGPAGLPQAKRWLTLVALGALGWVDEASAAAARALAVPDADALTLWWAVRVSEAGRDPALTARLAARLHTLAPDDPDLALLLGRSLRHTGDATGERKVLEHLFERHPDPALLTDLGMARERTGDRAAAEQAYRAVLHARGDDVIALNNLAWLLGSAGDAERRREAIDLAKEAARLAPRSAEVHDTLGRLLHLDGRPGEAVPHLDRAAQRAPKDPAVRFHLADALAAIGRTRRARQVLSVALCASATWPEAEAARALLARLSSDGPGSH